MKKFATVSLAVGLTLLTSNWLTAIAQPLVKTELSQWNNLGIDEQIERDRAALIEAIANSLRYLDTPAAATAYQNYAVPEFTRDRVRLSLLRFRQLLINTNSSEELQQALAKEFVLYQSVGKSDRREVAFTGYFRPLYKASRVATAEYAYPLYSKPSDFENWAKPHPTRTELEGKDGLLGNKSILSGHEIVWLRDRLEAFLVQVQGSAQLQLTDGSIMTVGYGGSTDYPYTSIGGEMVKDGLFPLEELTLPKIIDYFRANPQGLDRYIPRNNRFIFFSETTETQPIGSLGVPVTGDRSIATDKSLMPPGGLALIVAPIPYANSTGELQTRLVNRYVLDQDTGSAIKGAGRVDIFLGNGELAGSRAGLLNGVGQLYYLLLKN